MQTENWGKVKELLNDVLPLDTSAREKFFERNKINGDIRKEVESLLLFEKESENLMHLSAVEFLKDFIDADDQNTLIGQNIGVYQIIGELGYGGMGAVYLAERTDGKFEQKVALKLLKREMNTAALRRRFAQEREILASLQHPNIAGLLDAGTTDDKIPYIAMEYVEGLPIDDYCNKHRLNVEQRLDLFREVCAAVDFAHRNLIVHRDLKPSNILVTENGTPKLLDFGISKILSTEFEQLNTATITKMGVMTPGYASPEQLQNKSVTTATDVYSLGIILYELLSGHRPFETKESDFKEIYKAVIELEPPLPSAMAETFSKQFKPTDEATKANLADAKAEYPETEAANVRHTSPQVLNLNSNSIRGDLDNIVLKALRKERERRYLSAENLSEDIKRHLRGLPVTARPNTFSYRTGKFISRNKASVFAGVLIFLAIIGGITATLWQARVAQAESERARLEASKAEKINEYLQKVLNLSNPYWFSANAESNRNATIAQAVDEAAETIETELAGQPEIQAEIQFTLGKTYVGQGQYEKARRQLTSAREKFIQTSPDDRFKEMQINALLGALTTLDGNMDEGEKLLNETLVYFRANADKSPEYRKWLANNLSDLGTIKNLKGNLTEAEELMREGLKYASTLEGDDLWLSTIIKGDLGDVLFARGDAEGAIKLYREVIAEQNSLTDKPKAERGNAFYDLGRVYKTQEKYAEAEENIQKAYEMFTKTYGEDNLYTVMAHKQIAELDYLQGDYKTARTEIDKVLTTMQKIFPKDPNIYKGYAKEVLANILTKTGEAAEAEKIMREVLKAYPLLMDSMHVDIAIAKRSLGETLIAQNKFAEAKTVLTEAHKNFLETVGADAPQTKKCEELLAKVSN